MSQVLVSCKIVKANRVENAGVQFSGDYGAAGRTRRVEAAGSKTPGSNCHGTRKNICIHRINYELSHFCDVKLLVSVLTCREDGEKNC